MKTSKMCWGLLIGAIVAAGTVQAQDPLVSPSPTARAQGFRAAWDPDGDGPEPPRFAHIAWGETRNVGPANASCSVVAQVQHRRAIVMCANGALGVGIYARCDDANLTNDMVEMLILWGSSDTGGLLTVACDNTVVFPSDTLGQSDP